MTFEEYTKIEKMKEILRKSLSFEYLEDVMFLDEMFSFRFK